MGKQRIKTRINYDEYNGILLSLEDNLNEIKIENGKYLIRHDNNYISGNSFIFIYKEYQDILTAKLKSIESELEYFYQKNGSGKKVHFDPYFSDKIKYLSEAISLLNQIPKVDDIKSLDNIIRGIHVNLHPFDSHKKYR